MCAHRRTAAVRLWRRLGIGSVIAELLRRRRFDFPVERAIFVSVLHRLLVSGSDRDCAKWMADYAINGAAGLRLHHFYRAMAWLGGELAPAGGGDLAPYCIKDMIEERLFERRRNLFSDLSLVFMDTPDSLARLLYLDRKSERCSIATLTRSSSAACSACGSCSPPRQISRGRSGHP